MILHISAAAADMPISFAAIYGADNGDAMAQRYVGARFVIDYYAMRARVAHTLRARCHKRYASADMRMPYGSRYDACCRRCLPSYAARVEDKAAVTLTIIALARYDRRTFSLHYALSRATRCHAMPRER